MKKITLFLAVFATIFTVQNSYAQTKKQLLLELENLKRAKTEDSLKMQIENANLSFKILVLEKRIELRKEVPISIPCSEIYSNDSYLIELGISDNVISVQQALAMAEANAKKAFSEKYGVHFDKYVSYDVVCKNVIEGENKGIRFFTGYVAIQVPRAEIEKQIKIKK